MVCTISEGSPVFRHEWILVTDTFQLSHQETQVIALVDKLARKWKLPKVKIAT